jgi:Protein of unknown function (DUF4089)
MTRAEWGVDELLEAILDKLIDASAAALGLPVAPEWKPAIKANLTVTLHLRSRKPSRRGRPPRWR